MSHKIQQYRYIFSIIAVQTACAGAAFFIYYQMVMSAVSQSASADAARELSASLLRDAICTILWLGVLLGVIMYLFVTKVFEHFAKMLHKSDSEALRQVQSLIHAQDAIIIGLAKLAESRDEDTGQHLERMSVYACRLAAAASCHPKYRNQISGEFINLLRVSTSLHDIGKVGIQDKILLKPGRLTDAERAEMQRHPAIGGDCLLEIESRMENSTFLQMAREIVLCHHERWDGAGYPAGLAGEAIPLAARIASIADVYDALSSDRVYRNAYPHERCVAMIREEAGKQFDPVLVEIFLTVQDGFREIAHLYSSGWGKPGGVKSAEQIRPPLELGQEPIGDLSPSPLLNS
jgi:HD-GYP domain-containing protein (c-di-GMP phosphodiesterase class II)